METQLFSGSGSTSVHLTIKSDYMYADIAHSLKVEFLIPSSGSNISIFLIAYNLLSGPLAFDTLPYPPLPSSSNISYLLYILGAKNNIIKV